VKPASILHAISAIKFLETCQTEFSWPSRLFLVMESSFCLLKVWITFFVKWFR